MTRLHTYLNFEGNAQEAFNFYRSVFGGEFSSLVHFRDLPIEDVSIREEDQDKVMHIALPIGGDNILMASDTLPSPGQKLVQGNNVYVPSTRRAKRKRTGRSTPSQRGLSSR